MFLSLRAIVVFWYYFFNSVLVSLICIAVLYVKYPVKKPIITNERPEKANNLGVISELTVNPKARIPIAIPINKEITLVANIFMPPTEAPVAPVAVKKRMKISGLNSSRGNQIPATSVSKFIMNRLSNWIGFLDWRVKMENMNGEKKVYIVQMADNVMILYLFSLITSNTGKINE